MNGQITLSLMEILRIRKCLKNIMILGLGLIPYLPQMFWTEASLFSGQPCKLLLWQNTATKSDLEKKSWFGIIKVGSQEKVHDSSGGVAVASQSRELRDHISNHRLERGEGEWGTNFQSPRPVIHFPQQGCASLQMTEDQGFWSLNLWVGGWGISFSNHHNIKTQGK